MFFLILYIIEKSKNPSNVELCESLDTDYSHIRVLRLRFDKFFFFFLAADKSLAAISSPSEDLIIIPTHYMTNRTTTPPPPPLHDKKRIITSIFFLKCNFFWLRSTERVQNHLFQMLFLILYIIGKSKNASNVQLCESLDMNYSHVSILHLRFDTFFFFFFWLLCTLFGRQWLLFMNSNHHLLTFQPSFISFVGLINSIRDP